MALSPLFIASWDFATYNRGLVFSNFVKPTSGIGAKGLNSSNSKFVLHPALNLSRALISTGGISLLREEKFI